jgi:hypothetical protein
LKNRHSSIFKIGRLRFQSPLKFAPCYAGSRFFIYIERPIFCLRKTKTVAIIVSRNLPRKNEAPIRGLRRRYLYNELMLRIARVFPSKPGFNTAKKYIQGLLSPIERKNGWQMSEAAGERTPYVMRQFLYRSRFSTGELRDCNRGYANEKLGDEDGVPVVDETGFLKQGKMSCGVKRQYGGTAGRVENCQIGVFLTYASAKGHADIDRRLYIPEDWFAGGERCRKAGIPETVSFQTKPKQALSKNDIRILFSFRYRAIQTLQHALQWIIWRREHQINAMWFHWNKPVLQL